MQRRDATSVTATCPDCRDLEAQQREVGALRLQQERLAMAGVDARAVLRAPSSKRIITAASAYLSPVDTNRVRCLPGIAHKRLCLCVLCHDVACRATRV